MSIYGSGLIDFDADRHAFAPDDHAWRGARCAKWKSCQPGDDWQLVTNTGKHYRLGRRTACTCRCGPIAYRGSHVLPSDEDERGGFVDLSTISGFISREPDRPALSDDTYPFWPWLRLMVGKRKPGVDPATVVLDRWQVEQMRDALSLWLEHLAEPGGPVLPSPVHGPTDPGGGQQ